MPPQSAQFTAGNALMLPEKTLFGIGLAITLSALIASIAYGSALSPQGVPLVLILFGVGVALVTLAISTAARTSSQKDLKESEARFEQLFTASPIPTVVTTFD